ncbi:hypothetical protein ABZS86_29165 [Streptomyces sp. NPDC005355]
MFAKALATLTEEQRASLAASVPALEALKAALKQAEADCKSGTDYMDI